jgi:hypothetical protein
MPRSTFFIGIGTPIRPVEHTRTLFGLILLERQLQTSATVAAIRFASRIPCFPVQAFAFPEFTTIARARLRAAQVALTFTGAAQTRLVVNIPATAAGTSDTIKPRSRFTPLSDPFPVPSVLIPQCTAAA